MNSKVEAQGFSLDTVKLAIALLLAIAAVSAFYIYADQSLLYRVLGLLAGTGASIAISLQTDKGQQILKYFQGAQIEVRKVVWPTRQETVQTTIIVILLVVLVAVILWLLDMFLGWAIGAIMG